MMEQELDVSKAERFSELMDEAAKHFGKLVKETLEQFSTPNVTAEEIEKALEQLPRIGGRQC